MHTKLLVATFTLALAAGWSSSALAQPESTFQLVTDRGGPRNSDSLLRWNPDQGEGVWHATEETKLPG